MTTIPHRQLRNESREILERVKSGEIIDVTIKGEMLSTLIPPSSSPFERLLLRGAVHPAAPTGPVDFTLLAGTRLDESRRTFSMIPAGTDDRLPRYIRRA